jgi:hypothetical protein
MTKTKQAEIKILSAGYKIEFTDYFKGKQFVKALKENEKTVTATNFLTLAKLLNIKLK